MLSYKDFLNENAKRHWVIDGDFKVNSTMVDNGKLIKDKMPDVVTGNFICIGQDLNTLENSPIKVFRGFDCTGNKLTDLKGGPNYVGGLYRCEANNLISLEGIPKNDFFTLRYLGYNDNLLIEKEFIKSKSYQNNYWIDLLMYMTEEKISLEEVKGWPEGFLDGNIGKSVKSISKFNL